MLGQLGRADGAVPPPARLGRRDGHELVTVERRHGQLAVAEGQTHEPHVEVVAHEPARDVGRGAGDDDQIDGREARAQASERARQQVHADRRARSQAHASGHDAAQLLDVFDARL